MKFMLDANHKAALEKLANSGMTPVVIAQRAKILLLKASGKPATAIADEVGISRHTAELWIKKYRTRSEEDSIEKLLSVSKGRGRKVLVPLERSIHFTKDLPNLSSGGADGLQQAVEPDIVGDRDLEHVIDNHVSGKDDKHTRAVMANNKVGPRFSANCEPE